MFHALAKTCADNIVGCSKANRGHEAWRQAYRAIAHTVAKTSMTKKGMLARFPKPIEDFGNQFVALQDKRMEADYDPYAKFSKSDVVADIDIAEAAIRDLKSAPNKDVRALCALVLFRDRKA